VKRRDFITLLGGAAAPSWLVAAPAQQAERVRRIGVLTYIAVDDAEGQARLAAFTQALSQLGWSEGRNVRIDTRWATAGDVHRHAAELVALAPDVLLAATGMIWRSIRELRFRGWLGLTISQISPIVAKGGVAFFVPSATAESVQIGSNSKSRLSRNPCLGFPLNTCTS
jgi:hypothetical protein